MSYNITGPYGCSCHPFKDWDEHDYFMKQKIVVGEKYKIRHTLKECIVKGFDEEFKEFVHIFVEPYDCARCNQTEHKSNLIKI